MMQVPTSWIYVLDDPVTLMADWDLAADITNDLMGFPRDRGRETIYNQVDVLIRSGAYAPGYPAVNNTYTPGANSNGYENNANIPTDVDNLLLRLSRDVGVDIRPIFHFWGVPPINTSTLNNSIAAAKLAGLAGIYDTLVRYKSLIPADKPSFQTFATNWRGRQPLSTGYTEEANHAARWDTYCTASATATTSRAQQIINLYFPNGRPSDYGDWTNPAASPIPVATGRLTNPALFIRMRAAE